MSVTLCLCETTGELVDMSRCPTHANHGKGIPVMTTLQRIEQSQGRLLAAIDAVGKDINLIGQSLVRLEDEFKGSLAGLHSRINVLSGQMAGGFDGVALELSKGFEGLARRVNPPDTVGMSLVDFGKLVEKQIPKPKRKRK